MPKRRERIRSEDYHPEWGEITEPRALPWVFSSVRNYPEGV
jgi:hypothetical protein